MMADTAADTHHDNFADQCGAFDGLEGPNTRLHLARPASRPLWNKRPLKVAERTAAANPRWQSRPRLGEV